MSVAIERAARLALRGLSAAAVLHGVPAPERPGVAAYLLATIGNVPGAVAARAAGCSRQNISKMLRRVEARRDDPAFDALLSRIEAALEADGVR